MSDLRRLKRLLPYLRRDRRRLFTALLLLLPLSGACWRDEYDAPRPRSLWANIACAHEPRVVAMMHRVSSTTMSLRPRSSS